MEKKSKNKEEWLTGIMIGLMLAIISGTFLFCKVAFGATVNNRYDAERARAKAYLSDQGIEIPEEVEFWSEYYGERYEICPEIIEAVCWVESNCQPSAQSPDKACKGLMQIKPSCHTDRMNRLNARNIFGIRDNIKIGTDYLAELGGSEEIEVALTVYNGQNENRIREARSGKLSAYVTRILEISAALERSKGK